ncbi:MAG: hypothetical protein QF561_05120 [Phycisphaerales bacterium]|jgi:hypothetical protein|nr:hypothetical protein [Phycisphaerales bacterium]
MNEPCRILEMFSAAAVVCSGALAVAGGSASFKQVGASPADVAKGWLVAPALERSGAVGRCQQVQLIGTGSPIDVWFAVSASDHLAILPVGEGSTAWQVELRDPDGRALREGHRGDVLGELRVRTGTLHPFGAGEAVRYDVASPQPGAWRVRIRGIEEGQSGLLMIRDETPVVLRSVRSTWKAIAGEPLSLRAHFEVTQGPPRSIDVISAQARVLGGRALPTQCREGLVTVPLSLGAGEHTIWIDAIGVDRESGERIERSVLHVLRVEQDPIEILDSVQTRQLDSDRVEIVVPCAHSGTREAVLGGAEVWTTGADAECMAWIGGLVPLDSQAASFVLDTRWLAPVGAPHAEIELRNIRLADRDAAVLLGDRKQLAVGEVPVGRLAVDDHAAERAMRMGCGDRGGTLVEAHPRATPGGHNLMLVHGYCSDGISWPPEQFSGDVSVYFNPDQNFSHDEFALDIHAYGSQFKSYGIAGHSQGGNAALHLYSFYWSGLDWSTPSPEDGGRIIQALGVPFEGTALAGNIAALGEIFGIQCGANYDMTYDGAAYWLSFVPGWARGETWSWTTTFTDDWWSWDYCHIAADLVLSDPEDGVVESFSGDLDGTNFMGLKEGWCHIEGMTDPAQVLDTVRNNEINAEAAR